ncbi:MAG: S-isoprenylcysteine methyltransferase [Alphaproteobacteria bacterium HGW-Alphaproteobacteria-2]|nr:MAG: S-isoprenylcysteine methyltransferase [Alphaproteobacteria bacterium HGW-Alphaproteobacteria-2]
MPPVWLALFCAAAWAHRPVAGLPRAGGWAMAPGWALVAVGLVLVVAAAVEFRRHRTTIIPRETPSELIDSGVFRLTRNPVYLGDALVLAGVCLILRQPAALWLVPAFMALVTRRFIRGEEAGLRAAFPQAALTYMARVRRWL